MHLNWGAHISFTPNIVYYNILLHGEREKENFSKEREIYEGLSPVSVFFGHSSLDVHLCGVREVEVISIYIRTVLFK